MDTYWFPHENECVSFFFLADKLSQLEFAIFSHCQIQCTIWSLFLLTKLCLICPTKMQLPILTNKIETLKPRLQVSIKNISFQIVSSCNHAQLKAVKKGGKIGTKNLWKSVMLENSNCTDLKYDTLHCVHYSVYTTLCTLQCVHITA